MASEELVTLQLVVPVFRTPGPCLWWASWQCCSNVSSDVTDSRAGCIWHSQIAALGLLRLGLDWDRVMLCRLGCKGELRLDHEQRRATIA